MDSELKLIKVPSIKLKSNDGMNWEYEIVCYDDVTCITYREYGLNNVVIREDTFDLTAGFDIQVFEAALKLRKMVNEED